MARVAGPDLMYNSGELYLNDVKVLEYILHDRLYSVRHLHGYL
jgi:hypothetical protein